MEKTIFFKGMFVLLFCVFLVSCTTVNCNCNSGKCEPEVFCNITVNDTQEDLENNWTTGAGATKYCYAYNTIYFRPVMDYDNFTYSRKAYSNSSFLEITGPMLKDAKNYTSKIKMWKTRFKSDAYIDMVEMTLKDKDREQIFQFWANGTNFTLPYPLFVNVTKVTNSWTCKN
jgi:hypothetical protein